MHAALTDNRSNPAATGGRPQGVPNRIVNFGDGSDVVLVRFQIMKTVTVAHCYLLSRVLTGWDL